MTLWDKGDPLDNIMLKYTVGNDHVLDLKLLPYDCKASLAHARMLHTMGHLTGEELEQLQQGLNEISDLVEKDMFPIKMEQEDCHTAIEEYLTKHYGQVGKKLHTGRSRNDQVLTALRLYEKDMIEQVKGMAQDLAATLKGSSQTHQSTPLPGYTHMQKAMPTTAGAWLEMYACSLSDDLRLLDVIGGIIDTSPLGSAAGFGVPVLEVDRSMTSKELDFSSYMENPLQAQHSRGKYESMILHALSQVMLDLNRLASDLILFNMSEFGLVTLPPSLCTGSSIMPQKKNPDVLELIRANYHIVVGEQMKLQGLCSNLMFGYHRDLQLTKGPIMSSFEVTMDSVLLMEKVIDGMEINVVACEDAISPEMLATQKVYELVQAGVPFRDAYIQVAKDL